MTNKILLVDGNNLLFQMFFGMPARIVNADGVGIWGVIGFVGALRKIMERVEPAHVAVLFDGEHENVRTSLDTNYKANRADYSQVPEEENPFSQLPYIFKALEYLGIVYAETTSCEADDWISAYVRRYGNENEIVISSFDSDFFQLIRANVSVLRYRGEKTVVCGEEYLAEKYGITPCQYADFKSLTGDAADNIKGAEKVGPKTASALLKEFGTLDNVIRSAENIQKPSVRLAIIKDSQRLLRNYKLIKLEGTAEVPFTINEMKYIGGTISTTDVLRGIGLKE